MTTLTSIAVKKLKFKLIDYISKEKMFKKVMKSYLTQYDKTRGYGGELSPSQILATGKEV